MRILIVNDDGIMAPGIRTLTEYALRAGHTVTVYAPDSQRSAASHAISLHGSLHVTPVEPYIGSARAYAVSGTPADCASIGIYLEKKKGNPIDFVLSGINNGANRGAATLYSGTVGAAAEASLAGYPALAVSRCRADDRDYEISAGLGLRVMEWAVKHPLPRGYIYNLNVPPVDYMPDVKPATLSTEYIFDPSFTDNEDGTYSFIRGSDLFANAPDSDTAITESGSAALSAISSNLFDSCPDLSDFN